MFLVHLSRRLKCTIVITRCPSSVVRSSVVVNFSHFRLFSPKPLNWIQQNLTDSKISTSSTTFVFFGTIEKNGRPDHWLAETCSTSPLKHLNEIQRNLTGSKISTSSFKFVFFWTIGKTRWPSWSLIRWDIFDFSSESAERNLTKLDRQQDLNVLYQVCVFLTDQKNKMAASASDWLRQFRFLLCNRSTELNETWLETRSQCLIWSFCFSGRSEEQDGLPGVWLAEPFSTSPLNSLNGIQQNLTESKNSKSLTRKSVIFRSIWKPRWLPCPFVNKGGTLFSGARYVLFF